MLKITIDARAGDERLRRMPDLLRQALAEKESALGDALIAKAEEAAPKKSGLLSRSLRKKVSASKARVVTRITVTGKARAYAEAQERGAKIPAHLISPKQAGALAFLMGGATVFAGQVNSPGAIIPAHPYMKPAINSMASQIRAELIATVKQVGARK